MTTTVAERAKSLSNQQRSSHWIAGQILTVLAKMTAQHNPEIVLKALKIAVREYEDAVE
jgi:hypothetical protein